MSPLLKLGILAVVVLGEVVAFATVLRSTRSSAGLKAILAISAATTAVVTAFVLFFVLD